ncbi:MAG TPA: CBS domain-containing protein [Gemmatimonadaceae bacterium]|nr:CBS domain-containing protein [Gemmatimonadaceae bacterium]
MKAKEIMTKRPKCVTPDTPLREAARLMKEQDVGVLPVVDRAGSDRLVGIVTDRDIAIRHVAEGHDSSSCPVREAMTSNVRTAREDDDIDHVMDLMGKEQVRRIPVVDERGDLVGIVAQADIVRDARDEKKAERTIERISEAGGKHSS